MRTTLLSPNYVYVGDPGDEEDAEVVESHDSDSSVEVALQVPKVGPPTKRKRMDPSPPEPHRPSTAGSSRRRDAASPVPSSIPSVSTRSRTQALAVPPTQAKTVSLNSTPAPDAMVSSSSRPRKTSVRAACPSPPSLFFLYFI